MHDGTAGHSWQMIRRVTCGWTLWNDVCKALMARWPQSTPNRRRSRRNRLWPLHLMSKPVIRTWRLTWGKRSMGSDWLSEIGPILLCPDNKRGSSSLDNVLDCLYLRWNSGHRSVAVCREAKLCWEPDRARMWFILSVLNVNRFYRTNCPM